MMVAANRKRTATALHDGRNHASVPTLYADLQDQTEAQSQTTWERGSQTSISRGRTSHFTRRKARVPESPAGSVRRVPGWSGDNDDSARKNGTGGDRPTTTSRRPRQARSALMQGLASRKPNRSPGNSRNDNRRAMQDLHGSDCHACHTSRPHV